MKISLLKHTAIIPKKGIIAVCFKSGDTKISQGQRIIYQLFLRGKRIFTVEEATQAAILEKIPEKQLVKILSTLAKRGLIKRLRRGLYVSTGLLTHDTELIHPFVISAYLIQPSTISHSSALQYHGLTEQLSKTITASTSKKVLIPSMRNGVVSNKKIKHAFEIDDIRYEYISVQKQHFYGYQKIWLNEQFKVDITDKERTLLDVFISSKLFGGLGEALGLLEKALPSIDIEKLISYAILYGRKSLIKRLGWALEHFGISESFLKPLLQVEINHYCRLNPSKAAIGPCESRWMIQNNLIKE